MGTKPKKAAPKPTAAELLMQKQVLLLWAILGEGGEKAVSRSSLEKKGMLPGGDNAVRAALVARGLIKAEARRTPNDQGRSVNGIWMSVTDAGRAWAEDNLAAIPAKSFAAAAVLQAWLTRLSAYMSSRHLSLSEILEPRPTEQPEGSRADPHDHQPARALDSAPPPDYEALRAHIREAYLAATGGRLNTRARLSDIRARLRNIDRVALDEALKRMQREQDASLYPFDNKTEITETDRDAAIYFGGEPRHILWIEQ